MELVKTSVLASALGISKKSVLEKARQNGWAYVEKNGAWQHDMQQSGRVRRYDDRRPTM